MSTSPNGQVEILEDSKGCQSPNVHTSYVKRKSVMCVLHEGMCTQHKGVDSGISIIWVDIHKEAICTNILSSFLWIFTSHYGSSWVIYVLLKSRVNPLLWASNAKERDVYSDMPSILEHWLATIFEQQPLLASFGNSKHFDWVRRYDSTITSQIILCCIISKGNNWNIPFPQIL